MKRKPQKVCICGHAKSKHIEYTNRHGEYNPKICSFCWYDCVNFQQDNLRTLEKLHEFKEKTNTTNISL